MKKQSVFGGIGIVLSFLLICTSISITSIQLRTDQLKWEESMIDDWKKTFGGKESDIGYDVEYTTDNGFIIIGTTQSKGSGNEDIWLLKPRSDGSLQWEKTYGGKNSDIGYAVKQTNDNGFILTGYTWKESEGKTDVWLIKTDKFGNEEWNVTIGGNQSDIGYDVKQTIDNGFIIVGSTESEGKGKQDVFLVKTNVNGSVEWTTTFGGSETDVGRSLIETSDGNIVIIGHTNSFGSGWFDLWIIKTDAEGNKLWTKPFGGGENDIGWSVQETNDEGFICIGYTNSFNTQNQDIWLLKTDKQGHEEWSSLIGKSHDDKGYDVKQTMDNGYILIGSVHVIDNDLWLIKTDEQGVETWNKSFGKRETDIGRSVIQTSDGNYVCLGWTRSYGAGEADVWLIKVSSQNHIPTKPHIVSGVHQGKTGKEYTFSAVATDIDDDQLWYQWDWGDGEVSAWIGPFQSGESCELSHVWTNPADMDVTVKVTDERDAESEYSNPYTVSISYQTALLIGTISNKQDAADGIQFDAVTMVSIAQNPFEIKTVTNTTYHVADEYRGLLLDSFLIGKFNIKQII